MLTFDQMKELIQLVGGNKLGGVEVRQGDFHFRVSARGEGAAPLAGTVASEGVAPPVTTDDAAIAAETPVAEEETGHVLKSPIVGTFYSAPSPDAEPYVRVGDRVEKGQVVCIVEAMKLMNEIEADASGVVSRILPENAQPVEFGAPLFRIETD